MHSEKSSLGLKIAAWGGLVFLHFPILIIFLYAFNTEEAAFSFPPQGFTLQHYQDMLASPTKQTEVPREHASPLLARILAYTP